MEEARANERVQLSPKELFERIRSMLPDDAGYVKAEFEGPDIVVYLKNLKALYKDDMIIRNIASSIKKKLIMRSDPSALMDPERAKEAIERIVPKEAGINNIRFVPEFSEVHVEAMKPGLVIGKHGSNLRAISMETAWTPKVLRTPTMESDTLSRVRQLMFNEADFRKKFMIGIGKTINKPIGKSEWLKATALGGFSEVGRSCLLLETPHSRILIDCGLSPESSIRGADANAGSDINKAFPYIGSASLSISELDAIVVSHAHMDHTGFIPYLFKSGYEGPVYCTPPTRDLAALLLSDYIRLSQRVGGTPLYGEKDIRKMLTHMVVRDYGEVTNITDELKLTYHNAGHILGSAIVHLHVGEGMHNIVYTGDMKYGFTRLYDPASTRYPRVDSLFIESTYGAANDIGKSRDEVERQFMGEVKSTIDKGGKVLIPLVAVGRSQEVQLILENYMNKRPEYKMEVPVYLDGMILEASAMHTAYPEYLKESLRNRILNNKSPFESEIFEIVKGEREEVFDHGPAIILASGGMMNGGTSVEYFKRLADSPQNKLLFVGYNSLNSLGRRIENGLSEVALPNGDGKLVPIKVNMEVRRVSGISGHSDRRQLINFTEGLKPRPKSIFVMHGEERKCEDLSRTLGRLMHADARSPRDLDSIRLK
jgi:KH/beta-lactamase-domain protein